MSISIFAVSLSFFSSPLNSVLSFINDNKNDIDEYIGRGNVIIKYPGTSDKICSFVGSHLDVVPAEKTTWERNPFKLFRDGDILYGRGMI